MAEAQAAAESRIYCEKLKCDLSRGCCIRRQYIATRYEFGRMGTGKFEECVDCYQGAKLKGGNGMGNIELKCRMDGCEKPVKARWMCSHHYDEWYKRGKNPKELPEGLGERGISTSTKRKPKVSKVLKAGKNAPASITHFVDGLMAEMRREVMVEMKAAINEAFDRMSR